MSEPDVRPTVRRSGRDDGMTIVELMVALTIVMIAFAALASTLLASFASIRNTEARVRGVALANEVVEEMASIPWRHLGFDENDADIQDALAALPGDDEFEGEPVVLLEAEGGEDDPFLRHTETIERDGRDYQTVRWVTWTEEDDADELIRMVAIVSWELRGRTFEIRSEGLRAPDAQDLFDLEVSVDVVADYSLSDGTAMWLGDSNEQFRNRRRIDITATLGVSRSNVELRYRNRAGTLIRVPGASAQAGESLRTWTISPNSVAFTHGPVAFTVVATGPAGQVASDTATLRFYQALDVRGPVVKQGGTAAEIDNALPMIRVADEGGALCAPVTIEVEVHGMTAGEATPQAVVVDGEETDDVEGGLTLDWDENAGDSVEMGLVEGTAFGGSFEGEIVGVFPPDLFVNSIVNFSLVAERKAEHGVFEADQTVPIPVVVVEGC